MPVVKDYIKGVSLPLTVVVLKDFTQQSTAELIQSLGMSMVEVARRLDITPAAARYSIKRGEKTPKEEE